MDPTDRRVSPRGPLYVPISIEIEGGGPVLEAHVLNASEGGLYVLVYAGVLDVGMTVRVAVPEALDESRPAFSSEAEVIRVDEVLMAGTAGGAVSAFDVGLRLETPFPL